MLLSSPTSPSLITSNVPGFPPKNETAPWSVYQGSVGRLVSHMRVFNATHLTLDFYADAPPSTRRRRSTTA